MKPQIFKAGLPSQIGKWKKYLAASPNFRLLAATTTLYIALTLICVFGAQVS